MLCNSSPSRVLAQWITPHPNTTSQLIKETQTTPAAEPGPKSDCAAGPAHEAASSARNCGTGRALPPQHPCGGGPVEASPTPAGAYLFLGKSEAINNQRTHLPKPPDFVKLLHMHTRPGIYILLWLHPPFVFWLSKCLERKKTSVYPELKHVISLLHTITWGWGEGGS